MLSLPEIELLIEFDLAAYFSSSSSRITSVSHLSLSLKQEIRSASSGDPSCRGLDLVLRGVADGVDETLNPSDYPRLTLARDCLIVAFSSEFTAFSFLSLKLKFLLLSKFTSLESNKASSRSFFSSTIG